VTIFFPTLILPSFKNKISQSNIVVQDEIMNLDFLVESFESIKYSLSSVQGNIEKESKNWYIN
jgi:hypothetical protein